MNRSNCRKIEAPRTATFGAATLGVALVLGALTGAARAGGPLPYDGPTPPPNVSTVQLYNIFSSASSFYTSNGVELNHTHIQTDVPVLRLTHTFSPVDGMIWGIQAIEPDVAFLGGQEVGGASLSHNSGFAEPQLSAFIYPYNNPTQDGSLVLAYFLSPPTGAFNQTATLNASTNNWVNNFEVGFTHKLFGTAKSKRLDIEVWWDSYFYSTNSNALYGAAQGAPASVAPFPTTIHTEPAGQLIVYLPYYFHPQTDAYVGLSFEQTFGGKQYLTTPVLGASTTDTGNRNNFTQIGAIAGSFLSPTVFAEAELSTDVRSRGGAKNDVVFLVQIGKVF
ncbi:transporter [Acidiphilium sp.]|uniref:transporter n=1 Tax=Acidiphilium sp. TaxID=527 RepID=UPI003CFF6E5A